MTWSDEAVQRNRRKKYARRLWRDTPLFAYPTACEKYPDYSLEEFQSDISQSKKHKAKKGKNGFNKYGRYPEMCRLLQEYRATSNVAAAARAQQLRRLMTKPFRLAVSWNKERWEFTYPATTSLNTMKQLSALADSCKSRDEFKEKSQAILKYAGMGS